MDLLRFINFLRYIVLFPIVEELLFRWGLLDYLDRKTYMPRLARRRWFVRDNLIVSGFFASVHFYSWGLEHALWVLYPSLFLGWLWQRYKSLALCCAFHIALNYYFIFGGAKWWLYF